MEWRSGESLYLLCIALAGKEKSGENISCHEEFKRNSAVTVYKLFYIITMNATQHETQVSILNAIHLISHKTTSSFSNLPHSKKRLNRSAQ